MLWIVRFSALLAAVTWFVGVPLVTLSSVPLPSDAESFLDGALGALLGVTLMPVIGALRHRSSTMLTAAIRISGLAVSAVLILSGGLLILAATGKLGERAPGWIPDPFVIAAIALFLWIGLASYALRGSSSTRRAVCWLGILTAASFLLPLLASLLLGLVVRGAELTNLTFLPFLLLGFLLWVSLPAWLTAVVVHLWPGSAAQRSATARPS